MVTALITSFILFAAISYAIYWWQRGSSTADAERVLPPPRTGGLFSEISPAEEAELLAAEQKERRAERRSRLLARASEGDKKSLDEALESGDAGLYDEVLDTLSNHAADSDPQLLSLVSYVARNDSLRFNRKLAEKFIESWKRSPDRNTTAKMLHVAALSGDARVYQQAIETTLEFWRDGRVPALKASELRQLAESEYWLLPAESRNSGAGFTLKQMLARLRRELAATTE